MKIEDIIVPVNKVLIQLDKFKESETSGMTFEIEDQFIRTGTVLKTTKMYFGFPTEMIQEDILEGYQIAFMKEKYVEIPGTEYAVVSCQDIIYMVKHDK